MISFRYHIVSIIAVFLALALGIVVGTTALNGPITTNLRNQVHALEKDQAALNDKTNGLQTQLSQSQDFAKTYSGQIIKNTLANQKVLLVGLPGADSDVKKNVASEIAAAGGSLSGQIQIGSDYIDPKRAGDMNELALTLHPVGLTLPTTDDTGVVVGALLSWVLLGKGKDTDIQSVMSGFSTSNYLKVEKEPKPASLIVVVAGGTLPDNDSGGKVELALVNQLQQAGGHVVVVGDAKSATGGGVVALVRSDDAAKNAVSTVDNADTLVGQLSSVLALAGIANSAVGHYGSAPGVKPFPPLPDTVTK